MRSSALYSARSISGSSRMSAALTCGDMSRKRIRSESLPSPGRSTRMSRELRLAASFGSALSRAVFNRTKSVGVENDDREARLQQDPFQRDTEGEGLARTALTAPESVPVEPGWDETRHDIGSGEQRTHAKRSRAEELADSC